MTQGLIMFLVCVASVVGVLLYVFFSKVKKSGGASHKESPFLGSESTNSYHKGVTVYENLHNNSKKAQFKGDHRRNA
jgi:hypothetical protein